MTNTRVIALQIHGMRDNPLEFSVSNGMKCKFKDSLSNRFARILQKKIHLAGSRKLGNSCNQPGHKTYLCGTTNVQGRFSNKVPSERLCTTDSESENNTNRFLHLECSYRLNHHTTKHPQLGPHLISETINELLKPLRR